ncbi:GTP-binding protein Rho1, partial [Coemansia furcata]
LMDEKQVRRVQRKMVVIGDGACGKTCLLQTFRDGAFPSDDRYIPTVFDVCIVDLEQKRGVVELALWDTAGQEDFDRLRIMSYPEADVVVICFSVDSRDSLENVWEKWVPEARRHAPGAKLVLAGLKIDLRTDSETLEHMRRVCHAEPLTFEQGVRVAKALSAPMQAVFRLILEGLAMFAGSWAAGCVPLYVRLDQSKFNLLALFGAGLLIGAALAVILPEGVETLSRSLLSHKTKTETDDTLVESMNTTIGWTLVAGFCLMFLIDNVFPSAHSHADTTDAPDNDSAACLDDIQMTPRGNDRNLGNSEFTLNDSRL